MKREHILWPPETYKKSNFLPQSLCGHPLKERFGISQFPDSSPGQPILLSSDIYPRLLVKMKYLSIAASFVACALAVYIISIHLIVPPFF